MWERVISKLTTINKICCKTDMIYSAFILTTTTFMSRMQTQQYTFRKVKRVLKIQTKKRSNQSPE